jgi:hypothetical protein
MKREQINTDGLKEAYNRLTAWADYERIWARYTPGELESEIKLNRAKNYEAIAALIDRAIVDIEGI